MYVYVLGICSRCTDGLHDTCLKMAALLEVLLLLVILLLRCGDIEYNPGPGIRHPCGICYQPVRRNQKALLYDLCDYWIHCKCSGVDN